MASKKSKARLIVFLDLIFFAIFTFILLSVAFFDFYRELGIRVYVIIGSVSGIIFTMLFGWWLAITKRSFLVRT
jgi:hypothetical protein